MTLINISAVKNWFKPSEEPAAHKDICVLLVFCDKHVCSEWIDDDHKWKFDVEIPTPEGKEFYKKGTYTALLSTYIKHRKNYSDQAVARSLLVWGQKKAWCDTEICCLLSRTLKCYYPPQALIFCDCLGARWSEQSLLEHYENLQIMVPYAPGSTAFLQEPDTHEHAQLKATIRECKAELHFNLEQECKRQGKPLDKVPWGPHEYVGLVEQSLKKFKQKYPSVPLAGAIQLHMLAVRPDPSEDEDGNPSVQLKVLEDCDAESTKALLSRQGMHRWPPNKGIASKWCQKRDASIRALGPDEPFPKPDWDKLANAHLFDTDLPLEPNEDDVIVDQDIEDLDLTHHQRVMLLPVDLRIKELMYPSSVQARNPLSFPTPASGISSTHFKTKIHKYGTHHLITRVFNNPSLPLGAPPPPTNIQQLFFLMVFDRGFARVSFPLPPPLPPPSLSPFLPVTKIDTREVNHLITYAFNN